MAQYQKETSLDVHKPAGIDEQKVVLHVDHKLTLLQKWKQMEKVKEGACAAHTVGMANGI